MSFSFIIYLILSVLFWTSPLDIMTFQPEIGKQSNYWRLLFIPYRWNIQAVFIFILMLMLEFTGMSFIALLISVSK